LAKYWRATHVSTLLARCGANGDEVWSPNIVVGETWTFLRRRAGFRAALTFVHLVEQSPGLAIHRIDEAAEREAWAWLRRHDERVYSFVDATSFVLMRRLGIVDALAFDGDFSAAGFVEARP